MSSNRKRVFQAIAAITVILIFSTIVQARIEWNFLNDINLDEKPLDIAITKDGATHYILCEKSIKIYSKSDNKISDTILLDHSFSQITISPNGENLLLTDTENQKISIIEIIQIYDMEIGQSPVLGKADASVTIFDFSDYQ